MQILQTVRIPEPIYDRQGRIVNERLYEEEMATAIGDAVALAVARLKDEDAKSRVIILLSDGENTAGVIDPEDAVTAAKVFGIRVYTIGVGTNGMAPFPATDAFGRDVLVPRPVRLDEETLIALAEATGGRYFNAKNTGSLRDVYAEIDRLEKTKTEGFLYTEYDEWFQWPLGIGLVCVLLEVSLSATRFRSLP